VAQQISQQLSATQSAFHYPDQLLSCAMRPPPYETLEVPKQDSEEKQPLNV
jgi:hypothetical protein